MSFAPERSEVMGRDTRSRGDGAVVLVQAQSEEDRVWFQGWVLAGLGDGKQCSRARSRPEVPV